MQQSDRDLLPKFARSSGFKLFSKAPRWGRAVGFLGLSLILVYGGVLVFFVGLQRSLIYAARKGAVALQGNLIPESQLREVLVPTPDGIELHGWLSLSLQPIDPHAKTLVILFPGNAGNRSYRAGILQDFNGCGSDAIICDYRGYAENAGAPSEQAFETDAQAVWNFARDQLQYPSDRIVLCGESLGGGVATRLAWELCQAGTPPAGLILRTTFTSLTDAAKNLYPWLPVRTFLVDRYPSIDRIGQITCPILVIHGKLDNITPFSQGEKLFAAAPEMSSSGVPKTFLQLPDSGHNDLQLTAAPQVHQAHLQFLNAILTPNPLTSAP